MCDNDNKEYFILKKYFEGSASDEEQLLVYKWMSDPEFEIRIERYIRLLWRDIKPDANMEKSELGSLLGQINRKIDSLGSADKSRPVSGVPERHISLYRVLRTAGSIAAILLLPLMTYIGWGIYKDSRLSSIKNQVNLSYKEVICPRNARCHFELSDGTVVWLNNGSSLRYPLSFKGETRVVELQGEAFFDVVTDADFPFMIRTGGLDVRVTGTKLNVYAYPEEEFQEVAVESGVVELIDDTGKKAEYLIQLTTGQYAIYQSNNCQINLESFLNTRTSGRTQVVSDKQELGYYVAKMPHGDYTLYRGENYKLIVSYNERENFSTWKEGKLVLRNDPMPLMLKRIERWYNVSFRITDERINDYTYWATFENESLDEILNLLSMTGPLSFEKQSREVVENGLYKKQEIKVILK